MLSFDAFLGHPVECFCTVYKHGSKLSRVALIEKAIGKISTHSSSFSPSRIWKDASFVIVLSTDQKCLCNSKLFGVYQISIRNAMTF